MQDLLTLTAETIVIVPVLFLAIDFLAGLLNLYTSDYHKLQGVIAVVPTPTDSKETAILSDPWEGEGDKAISQPCCCQQEATPVVHVLVPAQEVIKQPEIVDFSGWTIRALKKEAQRRKLSKYSSLTKAQLVTTLTAV